jgi:hypothetical protein
MSRLDDAFGKWGRAMTPGASTWQQQWEEKLEAINEKAESLVQCDVEDCYVCRVEAMS